MLSQAINTASFQTLQNSHLLQPTCARNIPHSDRISYLVRFQTNKKEFLHSVYPPTYWLYSTIRRGNWHFWHHSMSYFATCCIEAKNRRTLNPSEQFCAIWNKELWAINADFETWRQLLKRVQHPEPIQTNHYNWGREDEVECFPFCKG